MVQGRSTKSSSRCGGLGSVGCQQRTLSLTWRDAMPTTHRQTGFPRRENVSQDETVCPGRGYVSRIQVQLLDRNVMWFRGGLVFKAHRLLYHSTLGSRVIKKKKKDETVCSGHDARTGRCDHQVPMVPRLHGLLKIKDTHRP